MRARTSNECAAIALQITELAESIVVLGLPNGAERSLLVKLEVAGMLIADDEPNDDRAAIALLHAFIASVEARRGRDIPDSVADDLVADAQDIIAALGG